MENNQPLLSICIPIYNRLSYLEKMLSRFLEDKDLFQTEIDLMISDNASQDDLKSCIDKYEKLGLNIRYNRNETNLGPDGNFLYCFNHVRGRYCWLLGSDDIPVEGFLSKIVGFLEGNDYGLFHIKCYENDYFSIREYENPQECLLDINYWITFMSANIINSKYIPSVIAEKYLDSFLIQVPFYLESCLKSRANAVLCCQAFETDNESKNNGGYNIFQVFIKNLFSIYRVLIASGLLEEKVFLLLKKKELEEFLLPRIVDFLILKKKNKFILEKAWSNILREYGRKGYFYTLLFKYICHIISQKMKNSLSHVAKNI